MFPGNLQQNKFVLKKKGGKIVQVTQYSWNKNAKKGKGSWERESKYLIKYGKKTINKYRFANMINDILMGENNYYAYMWY